jgi:hypothetical protein
VQVTDLEGGKVEIVIDGVKIFGHRLPNGQIIRDS